MANDDAAGRPSERVEDAAAASAPTDAWFAALDAHWDAIAPTIPPFQRPAIEDLIDQARRWIPLAGGGSPVTPTIGSIDALGGDPRTARYARALYRYAGALANVWSEVAVALARSSAGAATGGEDADPVAALRRCLDTAQACYLAEVVAPDFVAAQGALVDAAAELATRREGEPPVPFPSAAFADPGRALRHGIGLCAASIAGIADPRPDPAPRDEILGIGATRLWRYRRDGAPTRSTPVMVLHALSRSSGILDLESGRSLMRILVAAGYDAYLVDWGRADEEDATHPRDLHDYVATRLDACVAQVRHISGGDRVALIGASLGGTLALCYAALEPGNVARLATIAAPFDFGGRDDVLARWIGAIDADRLVDALGDVPGSLVGHVLRALRPLGHSAGNPLDALAIAGDPDRLRTFLRVEHWLADEAPFPGASFRAIAIGMYRDNALAGGTFVIGDRTVDPARVTMPVLNLYATRDPVVPREAASALARMVGTDDYEEHAVEAGHVGALVGREALDAVRDSLVDWLDGAGR